MCPETPGGASSMESNSDMVNPEQCKKKLDKKLTYQQRGISRSKSAHSGRGCRRTHTNTPKDKQKRYIQEWIRYNVHEHGITIEVTEN